MHLLQCPRNILTSISLPCNRLTAATDVNNRIHYVYHPFTILSLIDLAHQPPPRCYPQAIGLRRHRSRHVPILLKLIDDCDEDDNAAAEGPFDDNGMGDGDDPSYSYLSETMDDGRTIVAGGVAPEDCSRDDGLLSPTATTGAGTVGNTGGDTVKTSPNPSTGPSSSSMTMTSMADAASIAGTNILFL